MTNRTRAIKDLLWVFALAGLVAAVFPSLVRPRGDH